MIDGREIYEVRTERVSIPQSQKYGEIKFRGNIAYGRILGVNVYIEDADSGQPYNGNVLVGIREVGGGNRVLLAPAPYRLVKHSEQVAFTERFIELADVKGYGQDLGISIDASAVSSVNLMVTATVLYSKSR